jgi:LysM repeat protein
MSGTEQPKPGETLYLKKQNPVKPATRSYKEMLDEKHQIEAQYQKGLVSTYTTKPKEEPAVKKQPTVPAQTEEKPVEKLESATKDVLEETPSEATTASTHTVQPGDTLYSIALRYNVTIDEIKEMNGLSSNTIKVGQELKVGK